jgi:hypothetical protein
MGSAYTPGLKVSPRTTIEKVRRLPLKGKVLVQLGERVEPDTIVARTELPGIMHTVKLAEQLGIEPQDLPHVLRVHVGDYIGKGMILAQTKGLFGLFKSEFRSPVEGTLELISEHTGHLGIRQPPTPVEKEAYITGRVVEVIPEEGVVVRCEGALVQGIFGVGGERRGTIVVLTDRPDEPLHEGLLSAECRGKIVVGGSHVTGAALRKAAEEGVVGIVVGGIIDRELVDYLRLALDDPKFDIGVAITGQEPIPLTLVLTEGFGAIRMAERTFQLLRSLEGKRASMNGATQIRAGVIRPEVIVPLDEGGVEREELVSTGGLLEIGTLIRVIREPYFGLLGTVTELPLELVQVESETWVRVLKTKLEDGREVIVPRANVEIIEGA